MTVATATRESPYVGLRPFEADDKDLFFGRDEDIGLIVANLYAAPLTVLYGPTGVGKTSVLQAGVHARLRDADGAEPILFSSWHGRGEAARRLHARIAALAPEAAAGAETLTGALAKVIERRRVRVMLILDQFEEYFLYHPRADPLDAELAALMNHRNLPVNVLLSMREDGLASLDRFEAAVPGLFDNYLRFDHLSATGARDAIEEPLKRFRTPSGQVVEPGRGLTKAVLAEVREARRARQPPHERLADEDRYEAAYLQLTMERLWRARDPDDSTLEPAALKRLGGVTGILRLQVDEALNALSPERQDHASTLFRFLVTPSGSKIAYTPSDLAEYTPLGERAIKALLEDLTERYPWLIRAIPSPDGRPEHTRYQLVHDLLAEPVAAWRLGYLSTLAESERLKHQGTTFAELVAARADRDRDRAESDVTRPETEARYRAHLGAFEARFGKLEREYWGPPGHAVAVTRARAGLALHQELGPLTQDPAFASVLGRARRLELAAPELLTRRYADAIVRELADLLQRLVERSASGMDTAVAVEAAEVDVTACEDRFEAAQERSAGSVYLRGIILGFVGVLTVCAVIAAVAVAADFAIAADDLAQRMLFAFAFGACGGAASAVLRVNSRTALIANRLNVPLGNVRLFGVARPLIGAVFGLAAAQVLESGVVAIDVENDPTLFAIAFLAGFAERFAHDTVLTAEQDPEARPDRLAERPRPRLRP